MEKATIGFYGGTGSVTGANFLLDTGTEKFLIDCGLVQGSAFAGKENDASFPYDPKEIRALFVTHAHADHIGRIPKLLKDGFTGTIYSTPPTRDLAEVMLRDAHEVMLVEAKEQGTPVIYERVHIDQALARWETFPYGEIKDLGKGVTATLTNAGHILGSAFVTFARNGKKLMLTGDIGNAPQPLLDDPEYPNDISYLVMESVYGDRKHEDRDDRSKILLSIIRETVGRGGTVIIPAFSLERTQAIVYEINNFVEQGLIPSVPVFLDSPLAIEVTEIYRKYSSYLKKDVQAQIGRGDDIFAFPKLSLTRSAQASAAIHETKGPKIIIAGSGMSHGGRVRTHEREYLDDPKNTLLLVGHQTVGSVGRLLKDGARKVKIDGEFIRVRARIESVGGYSGHADRDALVSFVEGTADTVKKVFVAMGEEKASLFLVQRLRDFLGVDAVAPEAGSVIGIDW